MKDSQLDLFVETKVCKICNLEKPLDRFYQQGRKSLDNRCKACANEGKTWRRRERKK